jgi:hypothetical protein
MIEGVENSLSDLFRDRKRRSRVCPMLPHLQMLRDYSTTIGYTNAHLNWQRYPKGNFDDVKMDTPSPFSWLGRLHCVCAVGATVILGTPCSN